MINKNEIITSLDIFKVYFITSNITNIENEIYYSLCSSDGMTNLKKVLTNTIDNNINISIYSFDIIPNNIKDEDKDKETQKYKSIINLKYNNNILKGLILFKKTKNNFIYDFKLEENKYINNYCQINLNLNKFEQLKIYIDLLKKLKVKQGEPLLNDLILDSLVFLMGKNSIYYFDYFLEIFKLCFSRKEVKILLLMFKLDRVKIPNNFVVKDYSAILNLIEKKPDIILKYCNQNDDKNKYLKIFYTILLYFRQNFEKEKVYDLLSKKELFQYFSEILPFNHQFFANIEIPEILINEILKQKKLSYDIIEGIISYISSNKNKLISINNNIDSIFDFCEKNKTILNMIKLAYPKEIDNLTEIIYEIGKIINYELNNNKQFILFNEEYFKKYIEFDVNKNLEKKNLIKNAILICQTIDKNLKLSNFEIDFNEVEFDLDCPKPYNIINEENKKNNLDNNNILEKRLVMPTIGNVSVGKSYFLNSLFGIDFCQVKSDITTKFILFIRHIDNLNKPKLYNLKPIPIMDSYDFIKDDVIITGENNIKNKINEINSDFENDGKPMFYMLEIEIKSIENKTFLNKVDFLDVPGLNESNSDYINIYFPYIKDMIKYCLIIFSTENYNSKDALEVINKVKKNIYVPMENFLLILNKIDKVNGKIEETIHDFKKVILNNESINYYNNTIVPVNSLELKSEIQIKIDFYHFINYYFIEYNNLNKGNQLLSFLEYIKRKIRNIEPEKKQIIKNEINNLNEVIVKEIKQIFKSFIKEIKNKGNILIIDFENKSEINTLKIFYVCFIKKLFIQKNSTSLQEINNYFNKIKDYSLPKETKNNKSEDEIFLYDDIKEHKLLKNLDYFFNNTFSSPKLRKYGNIVPLLNKDFQVLKNYILNSKLIYIPILGVSNSGKSSFLNCLIQKEILTCDSSECTRRGMIIRYIEDTNKISLYSIKFKSSENLNNIYY